MTTKEEAERALGELIDELCSMRVDEWATCEEECVKFRRQTLEQAEPIRCRLAELEARVPRWIPVEKRSPEIDDEVLAFSHGLADAYEMAYFDGIGFRSAWDSAPLLSVSHWQPLPAPPAMGESTTEEHGR